jgi:hypothetical protein
MPNPSLRLAQVSNPESTKVLPILSYSLQRFIQFLLLCFQCFCSSTQLSRQIHRIGMTIPSIHLQFNCRTGGEHDRKLCHRLDRNTIRCSHWWPRRKSTRFIFHPNLFQLISSQRNAVPNPLHHLPLPHILSLLDPPFCPGRLSTSCLHHLRFGTVRDSYSCHCHRPCSRFDCCAVPRSWII